MITTTVTVPFLEHDPELAHRWSTQRAEDWMKQNNWLVGCNYIPGNAINQLEMLQEDNFSPAIIDK